MLDKLKKKANAIIEDITTIRFAYKDERTPLYGKILAAIVLAYAFSPVDLIPDFIPVLGYLDDLILIPLGIFLTLKLIPEEVVEDSRKKAKVSHLNKKKNWIAGGLIITLWFLIIFWIIKKIIFL